MVHNHRLVVHADLWNTLLTLNDTNVGVLEWLHIPSHHGILEKEEANDLAEQGRSASTLYHDAFLIPNLDESGCGTHVLDGSDLVN